MVANFQLPSIFDQMYVCLNNVCHPQAIQNFNAKCFIRDFKNLICIYACKQYVCMCIYVHMHVCLCSSSYQ